MSFRREKYVPKGGPDGGDGGGGGDVTLRVHANLSTLADLRHRKRYRAGAGGHGKGKGMHGKAGKSVVIPIPPGTVVVDDERGIFLKDLVKPKQELVVVRGGKGGRGNARFATSRRQAPHFAEEGGAGESRRLRLELKILADVGLVGLPNAGKSTLLARISAARPKIDDYPFTTLVPNLGIVTYDTFKSFVVADIPGLIEGAHTGKGLGDRFLRHVERTHVLVLLVGVDSEDIGSDYETLVEEMRLFNPRLLEKPRVVAFSKIDLIPANGRGRLPSRLEGWTCHRISAVTGEGIRPLLDAIVSELSRVKNDG